MFNYPVESVLSGSTDSLSRTADSAVGSGAAVRVDNGVINVNHTSAPPGGHSCNGGGGGTGRESRERAENEHLRKELAKYRDVVDQQETFIQV